ncbi:MAG: hypothetical protein JWN43_607 [Gammaproteobacteria bacterium]|nr:hypothetical protein [Gammaproteobacteria bacterium]
MKKGNPGACCSVLPGAHPLETRRARLLKNAQRGLTWMSFRQRTVAFEERVADGDTRVSKRRDSMGLPELAQPRAGHFHEALMHFWSIWFATCISLTDPRRSS